MATVVKLEPSSLYIATQIITNDDDTVETAAWHWSFFVTDPSCRTSQHHWNVIPGTGDESYQHRSVSRVLAKIDAEHSAYVVFCKLPGWNAPEMHTFESTLDGLYKKYEGIHYSRLRLLDPMRSCRTWIVDALRSFVAHGWLVLDHELWSSVEDGWFLAADQKMKDLSAPATQRYLKMEDDWLDTTKFKPTIGIL
ncbi:hypothetical protein BDZ89DRAFT_1127535 [Hymenopellis radicata]|nr:hypothetical protein BDZ89DRAFT_1127535 [Hymenopellis radicata]